MMRRTSIFAAVVIAAFAGPDLAAGRELRVPADHATIAAAVAAAVDGDVIVVSPGKYEEKLKLAGKKITLASTADRSAVDDWSVVEKTILDGGPDGKKKGPPIVTVAEGAELHLIGFTIQNSHHAVVNSGRLTAVRNRFIDNGDAMSFEDGDGVIANNLFENNSDDGIDFDGSSRGLIENNVIRNNRDDGMEIRLHKYRGETLEIVIRGNRFENNREDGLQLIDYPGLSDRSFRIERNVFVNNAMAAIGCMPDGNTKENYGGADLLEPVLLINNTFIGGPYGVTGGDNMVLLNNVFVETTTAAVKRVHGDSAAGVNLFWQNKADTVDCDLTGEAFLSVDPLLDEAHRPKSGSPCIDAGAASLRYNGEVLRLSDQSFSGSAPDLGSFEFAPAASRAP